VSRSWIRWLLGVTIGLVGGAVVGVIASDRDMQRRIGASTRQFGDRVAGSAQDVREKGGQWRDQRALNFGRAVFQAAEARDATLNAVDLDEDTGPIPKQSDAAEAESRRAL
jgi:hypothetical protein